uniref:ATP synthase subunit a n=1 Tax=Salinator rhamphidia TaxID=981055 RepID=G8HR53_9GAST|nr:ATP synthase F0 subunit 6 [Salinator rhamphidia]AEQ93901.1 ATP synthase subunit 6 [Salinator rhamphidia]
MLTDLFSALDGCASLPSWMTPMIFVTLYFLNGTWLTNSFKIFLSVLSSFSGKGGPLAPLPLFLFALMFFLVSSNLVGLTPFVYGPTSSLWLACSLAISLWGMILISGWVHSPKHSAAHLAPSGAPGALIPFLVLVETVSILIRPLTLTVRLVANISAGHIVLSLIANCLSSLSVMMGSMVFLISVGYNLFEVFVCFIQAYIFTLLLGLYAEEHP